MSLAVNRTSANDVQLSNDEIIRYSRHLIMPEVTLSGQRKLKNARVLCVGTGGLGSPVALYLAAAGVGNIGLVDYDIVEANNLQRQIIHGTSTIGQLKVESAKNRMLDINPYVKVSVHNSLFTSQNALGLAEPYDLIIDGTDNFPTRYLVNDVCVLQGKPNVYGSIFRFEGQVSVFWAEHGPCYRCLFPEPPPPGLVPSCAEGGVLGILPGTIGTMQATEAIKLIVGIGEPLIGKLLLYDALAMSVDIVRLKKSPDCVICGSQPTITKLIDYEEFCGMPLHDHTDEEGAGEEWDITVTQLKNKFDAGDKIRLIDVREDFEWDIVHLPQAELIPMGDLPGRLSEFDTTDEHVIMCRTGGRSAQMLQLLVSAGITKVKNLKGGIRAWATEIDPELPIY